MSDIVVTVPKSFTFPDAPGKKGLAAWIAEGDVAGEPWSGTYWSFMTSGCAPQIDRGERVYVVCENRLRGYAPLIRFRQYGRTIELIRGGGAVAVTLLQEIIGFRGWRYRWWDRNDEVPFPNWKEAKQ